MGQAIRDYFRKGQTVHANSLQTAYDKGGLVHLVCSHLKFQKAS